MRLRISPKRNLKKAQVRWIRALVILAITLIIVFVFQQRLSAEIKENTPKELCKLSVQQHAKSKIGGFDFSEEINCPTQQIIIKEDLTKEKEQTTAKKTIADAMADCWEQFGEGKLDLFQGDGIFCADCSIINFENPKSSNLNGFINYYFDTKITSGPGKGKTYSEYITGLRTKPSIEKDNISTSQSYAVMFFHIKHTNYFKAISKIIEENPVLFAAGVSTAGSVLAVGAIYKLEGGDISELLPSEAVDRSSFVFLLPYKKESAFKYCTYLPVKQGDWWEET